jgi:hypothetical protein
MKARTGRDNVEPVCVITSLCRDQRHMPFLSHRQQRIYNVSKGELRARYGF